MEFQQKLLNYKKFLAGVFSIFQSFNLSIFQSFNHRLHIRRQRCFKVKFFVADRVS